MTRSGASRLGVVVQYALLAGPLLSMLDSSVVNVAVEPIARELHASLTAVQWAVSGYLLALGAGLALTAYLARRFGTLPVYLVSAVGFTAASALCAAAPDAGFLVAARVLQGLAAAPLVPMSMSMMLGAGGSSRSISPAAGIMLFVGPALGPTAGGALIGAGGWRLIFLINVPLGAAAAVAIRRIPARLAPGPMAAVRFDLAGLVLLAAGLTALLYGASQGASAGWGSLSCWLPLAIGAGLLAGYAATSARGDQPALDLSLARNGTAALSMALCALATIVTWAAVFLLPVFVQSVQRRSALAAGLAMLPQGLITGISAALGSRVLTRFPIRAMVLAGFAVLAGASLGLLLIGAATPMWVIALILAVRSVSIGMVISPLLQALTQRLRPEQLADANTLFNAWQRVAASFGIGLIAALFTARSRAGGAVHALHLAGYLMAGLAILGAAGALALPGGSAPPGEPALLGDAASGVQDGRGVAA